MLLACKPAMIGSTKWVGRSLLHCRRGRSGLQRKGWRLTAVRSKYP